MLGYETLYICLKKTRYEYEVCVGCQSYNPQPQWLFLLHLQVSEGRYQGVAASLWPVATVQGAELQYIYIKKTCHEYELDGESQS